MKRQLEAIKNQAMEKLAQISDIRELEDLKVAYLGKKG
jgi:phenylalanyl-tRNA synthetase alpha chain